MWALVFSEKFSFTEVNQMDPHTFRKAHIALQRHSKEEDQRMKQAQKKKRQ
ncbi:hypothetical protein [Exiguobacterium sp. s127]|uniref:hypothetical protein n=1 Tax=Exiguobacterium sp. s127 TaxID=2751210 RepID=UPI001BE5614F|nr:hypothetical protein [Exiguobacterium sp. s127]